MKILNFFNAFRAQNAFSNTNWFELKQIVINNYAWLKTWDKDLIGTQFENNGEFHAFRSENLDTVDIYVMNLHIHIVSTEKDKIVSVDIKRPNDKWELGAEMDKPKTIHTTIYKWYFVTVMDDSQCTNEHYTKGAWDEIALKELKEAKDFIYYLTDTQKVSDEYKKLYEKGE